MIVYGIWYIGKSQGGSGWCNGYYTTSKSEGHNSKHTIFTDINDAYKELAQWSSHGIDGAQYIVKEYQ